MSEAKHTPGRLELLGSQGTAMWSGNKIVAQINESRDKISLARANARRIVACWNALDGFSTEELERKPPRVIEALEATSKIINRRDELLDALERIASLGMSQFRTPYDMAEESQNIARVAIGKATGQNQ